MITKNGIRDRVRQLLQREVGDALEAAFVYGSVAAGTATDSSDLDCFVLLCTEPAGQQDEHLRTAFTGLQRDLGLTPDLRHPVEVFSVAACTRALNGELLLQILNMAGRGDNLDKPTLDTDCLEVLRALLNIRLPVEDSVVLDSLTALAWKQVSSAGASHGIQAAHIASRVGVKQLHWSNPAGHRRRGNNGLPAAGRVGPKRCVPGS